jgi:hypothetical protein
LTDAEKLAERLIAEAGGRYDHARSLVLEYAKRTVEVHRLADEFEALPRRARKRRFELAEQVERVGKELTELFEMLTGPGAPRMQ